MHLEGFVVPQELSLRQRLSPVGMLRSEQEERGPCEHSLATATYYRIQTKDTVHCSNSSY